MKTDIVAIMIICWIISSAVIARLEYNYGRGTVRAQAVLHGYAEWEVDDYGRTEFVWNDEKEE